MKYEDIKKQFAGKWVLITNCEDEGGGVTGGTPVAVADTELEGYNDGFYDKFKNREYKPMLSLNLNYDRLPVLTMFFKTDEKMGSII
jgi:hypothetical protein